MNMCIRDGDENKECRGHKCVACGKTFRCHNKHICTPRPQRAETGIERTPNMMERLAVGMKMLGMDQDG